MNIFALLPHVEQTVLIFKFFTSMLSNECIEITFNRLCVLGIANAQVMHAMTLCFEALGKRSHASKNADDFLSVV